MDIARNYYLLHVPSNDFDIQFHLIHVSSNGFDILFTFGVSSVGRGGYYSHPE